MKMEDFRFELFELRDLARAKGVDRLKRVGRLLRKHSDTGKSALIWAGVAILLCVYTIAQGRNGSLRAWERWLDAVVRICYMVPIVIAYICSRIGRLIAASKRLNERAEMLGEDEDYQRLKKAKIAAEKALQSVICQEAWKQYLALDEICNELECARYKTMYLAGAADCKKLEE